MSREEEYVEPGYGNEYGREEERELENIERDNEYDREENLEREVENIYWKTKKFWTSMTIVHSDIKFFKTYKICEP